MKKILTKIRENKLLTIVIVVGAILRFYNLDFQSVWLDEIHTLNEANPNLTFIEVYESVFQGEQMPPLYFYIIYVLFKVFGYVPIVMRIFSAIIGVFSIYGIYLLGREMYSKKAGIIAALLLCINYFHILHSQEGRPYAFFALFTILSFYWLIRLLKDFSKRTIIYYSLFTALMLYGHYFGLFTLFSQYIIILFIFLISNKNERIQLFKQTFFSSLIVLILFLPALPRLFSISKITDFWIPKPTNETITLIFKEFFGYSEILVSLITISVIWYFISLYNRTTKISFTKKDLMNDRITFSFITLLIWFTIVIISPLIRSYLSVPMLLTRYFITLLPAIILLIAIGIASLKNKVIAYSFCLVLFLFSIVDLVVVKQFYTTIYKSQFREVTNFIKEKNKTNRPVVSSIGVYMPYFFSEKTEIINKNLDEFVTEMQADSSKIREFWYVDGHGKDYTTNEKTLDFLTKNFYVEDNFDQVSAWTKHFVSVKKFSSKVDLSKYTKINEINGNEITSNIEFFENNAGKLKMTGWAIFENQPSITTKTEIILIDLKTKVASKMRTQKVFRPDITIAFKNEYDLESAGFSAEISLSDLKPGTYKLALLLIDITTNKEGLKLTDREIVIN